MFAFGAASRVLPPRPVRTACMRGTATAGVAVDDDRAACQKTSKQMAGNRQSASTCFRASRARMELAMEVYILHGHASAGRRAYIHVGSAREDARASKQGEVTADDSHGYLGLAQLPSASAADRRMVYTFTPAEEQTCARSLDTFCWGRQAIGGGLSDILPC